MGVSTDLARANGWVSSDFKTLKQRGRATDPVTMKITNMGKFFEKIQAGLYEGIAYYLTTAASKFGGDRYFKGYMGLTQEQRTAIFQPNHYAEIAKSYGGPNGFVQHYYGVDSVAALVNEHPEWETENPYGNAVHNLATKGRYIGQDRKEHSLLP